MTGPPTRLEQALGHTFGDRNLLERALTHRSHDPAVSNERLEFLGDSVLEFVITGYLYAPSRLDEGGVSTGRGSATSPLPPGSATTSPGCRRCWPSRPKPPATSPRARAPSTPECSSPRWRSGGGCWARGREVGRAAR